MKQHVLPLILWFLHGQAGSLQSSQQTPSGECQKQMETWSRWICWEPYHRPFHMCGGGLCVGKGLSWQLTLQMEGFHSDNWV